MLLSFNSLYAGAHIEFWQFGNIKSWNKDKVKISLVTNKKVSVSRKWFKGFRIYENQPVRIIFKNKKVHKIEKVRFEEKLDLNIASGDHLK